MIHLEFHKNKKNDLRHLDKYLLTKNKIYCYSDSKEGRYMKLHKLSLLLFAAACVTSCKVSVKDIINAFTPSSQNNFDLDPTTDITEDTSNTDYDKEIEEEQVEVPKEYDGENVETISASGKYHFSGEAKPITITKKDLEVYLFFDGVTISSNQGIAVASDKKITCYIVLQNGSVNTITNDFADENAIHIKGDLHISGNGTLNIESKQKNGLKASKDLFISGEDVVMNVTGANHAISSRSITVNKATINVVSKAKDGFQLECDDDVTEFTKEQGFAYFVDAKITADTYGDGIQAETFVYISGGEFNITTHGEFVPYSTGNMTTYGLEKADFEYVKSGSSYKRVAQDEIRNLNSSYYALKNSVKGIKAGPIENDINDDDVDEEITSGEYEISIAHLAKITVKSTDDCIHTNYGKTTLDSCNLNLETLDDAVHADYDLSVNNASIYISTSYEGLEGANVTISGTDTNIVSYSGDDGINAASDLVSLTNITINDGYLRIYANGDGLDANDVLRIKGGTVIVEGPGSGNGSLDAGKIYFEGGIVFACSTSGMTEQMTATQNTFAYQGSTMSTNKLISITDSNSSVLFSYTLKQSCNQLIFSHPDLQVGSSYNIMADSSKITTISMTSSLTKVGISGGGPGGGGGGGWPH